MSSESATRRTTTPFMQASGYAVAVANALPAVKDEAELVTNGARGAGIAVLIRAVPKRDSGAFRAARDRNEIGRRVDGRVLALGPHGGAVLIAGFPQTWSARSTKRSSNATAKADLPPPD
jgi:hypothetical protein